MAPLDYDLPTVRAKSAVVLMPWHISYVNKMKAHVVHRYFPCFIEGRDWCKGKICQLVGRKKSRKMQGRCGAQFMLYELAHPLDILHIIV